MDDIRIRLLPPCATCQASEDKQYNAIFHIMIYIMFYTTRTMPRKYYAPNLTQRKRNQIYCDKNHLQNQAGLNLIQLPANILKYMLPT